MRELGSRVVIRNDRAPSETWFPAFGGRHGLVDPVPQRTQVARYPDSTRDSGFLKFNRRMRKTACPVVWKGHGAQSP